MTYIESALYDFVKTILTRGYRTLKDPKYLPYSIFLLLLVGTTTIAAFVGDIFPSAITITDTERDLMLYVELSAAIGFILVGFFLGRLGTTVQILALAGITIGSALFWWSGIIPKTNVVATYVAAIFYIAWIAVASFSTFNLFRDLFDNDVFGMVLFLGKQKDDGRPMFSLIALILVFVNGGLGYVIIKKGSENQSNALIYSGLIIILTAIIAFVPLLNLQRKYDVFFTILTTFYIFSTIRVVLLAFRTVSSTAGSTSVWDTIFSLFMALYAIQGAAVKGIKIGDTDDEVELSVEKKMMDKEKEGLGFSRRLSALLGDRGIVLIILGTVIGFHTMQIQSFLGRQNIFHNIEYTADADIVLLGYQVNLVVTFLIYVLSIIAFFLIPPFRRYANPTVRRIAWAPEYDDVKLLALTFKNGDMSWKTESVKLVGAISKNRLKSLVSSSTSVEDVMKESIHDLIEKASDIEAKKKLKE